LLSFVCLFQNNRYISLMNWRKIFLKLDRTLHDFTSLDLKKKLQFSIKRLKHTMKYW
jgi:hypothetical protein